MNRRVLGFGTLFLVLLIALFMHAEIINKQKREATGTYCTISGKGMSHDDSDEFIDHMKNSGLKQKKKLRGEKEVDKDSIIEWAGKSDLAYLSGHGEWPPSPKFVYENGELLKPGYILPKDVGPWKPETEWVVMVGCFNLAMPTIVENQTVETDDAKFRDFAKEWAEKTLRNVTAIDSAHGMLGYRDGAPPDWTPTEPKPDVWATDDQISAKFADNLKDGQTIIYAWLNASKNWIYAYESKILAGKYYSPLNAVAVFHEANVNDKLSNVTPDTNDNKFIYYYIEWEWDKKAPHVKDAGKVTIKFAKFTTK